MESAETLILELVWEYDYTPEEAHRIVDSYLNADRYQELYDLLKYKPADRIAAYEERVQYV